MRLWPLFSAPRLILSDTTREHARRAGIEGLRHKLRHKIPDHFRLSAGLSKGQPGRGGVVHVPARVQKKIHQENGDARSMSQTPLPVSERGINLLHDPLGPLNTRSDQFVSS